MSKNSNTNIQKFQSLEVDQTFVVKKISDPITGKFGTSYIIEICREDTNNVIKIWTTKLLAKYITNESMIKNRKKFTFTVKENSENLKYPVIDGYKKELFTVLED